MIWLISKKALFRKVQTFSFGNLDELETGQLITRLTHDVTQVQEAIMIILRMLVRAPLLLVGSLVMAIIISPQLAFLPIVFLPVELADPNVLILDEATSNADTRTEKHLQEALLPLM